MDYRVLIVDDEPNIVEGISFLINRFMPECQVVDIAFDGMQGIEKARALKPDIILTDIRMPELDGLEMISCLLKEDLNIRFIILSGFEEFEYARTAITLGVKEYITKPVDEDKLCLALSNACNLVKEERKKQEQEQKRENAIMEYELKDILESSESTLENIKNRLSNLGFPGIYKWYTCAILENNEKKFIDSREDFFIRIKSLVNRYLSFCEEKIVIPYTDYSTVLILAHESENQSIANSLGKLRSQLSNILEVTVSIGMGRMFHKVEEIRQSFEEAQCALNYKIIKGLDCVILYEQICDIDLKPNLVSTEDIKKLESCIDNMNDKGYKLVIEDIFRKIEKEKDLSLEDLQLLSLNLILSGIRKMSFMQLQMNEYLGKNIFSLESIAKFQTTTQLKNWIYNMIKSMNELMLKNSIPEKRDVIEEAKKYMSKNFNRNISLKDISERFFINPYYFSQLFKKKTGDTYQNYLIRLRVDRAKKLLEETDLKIYEICELVGYADISHFNKIFERVIGIKPSEYKKEIDKGLD